MILVVDTYNVLHVVGVLPPEMAGIDLAGLMQLIGASRYAGNRVELVCDGTPPVGKSVIQRPQGPIKLRFAGFSGRDRDADALIAALIAKSSAPKRLLVVTSDNWILRQARRRRCKVLSSEQFLSQLAADAATDRAGTPSPQQNAVPGGEVAQWLDYFQITPKELEALPKVRAPRTPRAPETPPPRSSPEEPPGESTSTREPARDHGPLTADIIEEAERIWAEQMPF